MFGLHQNLVAVNYPWQGLGGSLFMLFVGNSDNRAMRQPGKTSLDVLSLNTDYATTPKLHDAKARLQSSTYTVCVETTENPPNHVKNFI